MEVTVGHMGVSEEVGVVELGAREPWQGPGYGTAEASW